MGNARNISSKDLVRKDRDEDQSRVKYLDVLCCNGIHAQCDHGNGEEDAAIEEREDSCRQWACSLTGRLWRYHTDVGRGKSGEQSGKMCGNISRRLDGRQGGMNEIEDRLAELYVSSNDR